MKLSKEELEIIVSWAREAQNACDSQKREWVIENAVLSNRMYSQLIYVENFGSNED
jgi:hypothetical protein